VRRGIVIVAVTARMPSTTRAAAARRCTRRVVRQPLVPLSLRAGIIVARVDNTRTRVLDPAHQNDVTAAVTINR
jgi:hypothetical protein